MGSNYKDDNLTYWGCLIGQAVLYAIIIGIIMTVAILVSPSPSREVSALHIGGGSPPSRECDREDNTHKAILYYLLMRP